MILGLYISDLHVNKKKHVRNLLKKKVVDDQKISACLREQAQHLKQSIPHQNHQQMRIFIIGDVADNFTFFQRFFHFYHQQIDIKTYFILGNHEFKALFYDKKGNYDQIVDRYRQFLTPLGIELLEEELVVEDLKQQTTKKYQLKTILKLNTSQLKSIFNNHSFGVLGSFNGAELSQVHAQLRKKAADIKLIIGTHFPFKCWLQDEINPNWLYLYGHTHHNVREGKFCFADNQIGVQKKLAFKSFLF